MCFVYLLTVMEKKILQQFYSTSFEEKHYNQCIVNEKKKKKMQDFQQFNFLICLYSIEIHVIKRDHQPSVQTIEISNHISMDYLSQLDYYILHVKHKNQVYVFLIHNLNSLMN